MQTEAQTQAIENPGDTLVMAGAGTGKTSTLVNRVLHWVSQPGGSVERMLLVTFTEAAAAEMRQRLRRALTDRLREAEGDQADHLNEQLALLEQAQISTLHSFCLRLVREHFHLLGIDPDVRVLDEQQTRPLEQRVLDEMIREHLAGRHPDSPAVQRLLRQCLSGSDWSLRGWIRKLHRFVNTLADPEAWMKRELDAAESGDAVRWEAWLREDILEWRESSLAVLSHLRGEGEFVQVAFNTILAIPEDGDLAAMAEAMAAVRKPKRNWPRGTADELKDQVNPIFKEAIRFSKMLEVSGGKTAVASDWDVVRPHLATLLRLTQEFGQRFDQAKRELGGIDFADQEQLTLRLLRDESNGVAGRCREFYQQVFIDEAQDINHAQDAILSTISNGNRFIVGDVKQCIYQFRLTDPRIFDARAKEWAREDQPGRTIPLVENFRSHEAVVNFVNELFDSLMLPEVGGTDYRNTARLKFGARETRADWTIGRDPAELRRVEINVLTTDLGEEAEGEDENNLLAIELEARMAARRLRDLMDEGAPVFDPENGEPRPMRWSDVAVLLRSPGPCAEAFVREFRRFGIPLVARRAGFYSAMEVRDLINLLRLLDNPLQDIPLLAVLHSPLVGLSAEELGRLRAGRPKGEIWRGLKSYADEGEDEALRDKAQRFLDRYRDWRALSRQSSLSHCLEVILEQTHYEALLSVGEGGPERVGNIRRLLDLARQYDPYQRQGLHRFVRFVEQQEEADMDLEPVPPLVTEAVTLMSIHQSKGLEFPVVVAAGLGRQFNEQDVNAAMVVDETCGVGIHVYPHGPEQRYPSLPMERIRRMRRRELRAEELRLLYVACTRARDRLVLAGTINQKREKVEKALAGDLGVESIVRARRMLDWLLPWIGGQGATLAGEGGVTESFAWSFWRPDDSRLHPAQEAAVDEALANDSGAFEGVDIEALCDRIEFVYPEAGATIETAKTSVSELRRRATEEDELSRNRFAGQSGFELRGKGDGKISGAERGTLHHAFLQRIDLGRAASVVELKSQANALLEAGEFSQAEFEAIDYEALAGFWAGQLGRTIRERAGEVARELPFTVRLDATELRKLGLEKDAVELGQGDFVVVQGVVDLAVIGEERIVVLDYKTDSLSEGGLEAKVEQYAPQLRLYAHALEVIYRRPVIEAWLHFLSIGRSVNVLASETARARG